MKNLEIWDALKTVPKEAQKNITGGRLKGMTDIKPQWRYKAMTEQFGICGIGWYYEIKEKKIEEGANGEKVGFVDVNLFIKVDGEWSKPIPGTGGNSFIANEKYGAYTSDEVFKMALTDALSVAMTRIGVGASIYMGENDGGKYTQPAPPVNELPYLNKDTPQFQGALAAITAGTHTIADVKKKYKLSKEVEQLLTK